MVNLIPLFAVPHPRTLADLLGVTFGTFRQIHRSAGVTAVVLNIFHLLIMVASQSSFPLHLPQNRFAVIVHSLLGHFSPLTLYIGSIITRGHYSALFISLAQALWTTVTRPVKSFGGLASIAKIYYSRRPVSYP